MLGFSAGDIIDGIKTMGGISDDYSRISGVTFNGMTLGASKNVSAFVGVGDVDMNASFDEQNITGFGMENLDLALAIMKANLEFPIIGKIQTENFYSLSAHVDEIGAYGFGDVLKIHASDVTLELNQGGKLFGGVMRSTADFKASFPAQPASGSDPAVPAGLKIETGGDPVYLNLQGNDLIGIDIGLAEIQVSEFLHLRGSLASSAWARSIP